MTSLFQEYWHDENHTLIAHLGLTVTYNVGLGALALGAEHRGLLPDTPRLADVGDVEHAGHAVEGEAPRIAQSPGPHFRRKRSISENGIVRRDTVGAIVGIVNVDAQDGPQQRRAILTGAHRVVGPATIANADIQIAVRAEGHVPAVVIGVGLADSQYHARIGAISTVGIIIADAEFSHARGVVGRRGGVVHIEQAVLGKIGMEGQPQQAALRITAEYVLAGDIAQVNERRAEALAVAYDVDAPALLDDELASAAIVGMCDLQRVAEAGDDRHQFQIVTAGGSLTEDNRLVVLGQRRRGDQQHQGENRDEQGQITF